MSIRPFAVLLLALVPVAVRAAEDEHPYKNAKVGDTATYIMKGDFEGTTTLSVTAKTDKKVTIKVTGTATVVGSKKKDFQNQLVIDLTKPFEPTMAMGVVGGVTVKTEKLKDVKEKVTVNGKEYDATRTTYKTTQKLGMGMVPSEVQMWRSSGVPLGIVKLTSTTDAAGTKVEFTMELKESGSAKK